ncbi:MAG: hypothetical protein K6B44_09985 [Lachnospiraceae bacterium]|nr:hypothetical protein [Lachnospiraceae bacterium]
MLEVLIFWILIYLITIGAGDLLFFAFDKLSGSGAGKRKASVKSIAGFLVLTVAAEYISLFGPVNTRALSGTASVIVLLEVLKIKKYGWSKRAEKDGWGCICLKALWLVFILICTVNPDFNELHMDSDLYMVQSVKWAREYGAVRGAANFNPRIGFDSSLVCFYALALLKGMSGGLLHAACGFLYVLFGFYGIEAAAEMFKKGFSVSRAFRIVSVGYAATTSYLAGAFLTDSFSNLSAGFVIAEWAALAESKEEREEPYGLLAVFAVICASMKLSLAVLVLEALLPGIGLLKKKKFKSVAAFLGLGCACVIPYVLRTVILTGYLLFPMEKIDLFSVEWKMPADMVTLEREMVELWAKAPGTGADIIRGGIEKWLPIWLENQRGSYGYLLLLANIAAFAGIIVFRLIFRKNEHFKEHEPYMMILIASVAANMLYWFLEAPDYRFIELLMFFMPIYLAACVYRLLPKHFPRAEAILLVLFVAAFFSYHPKRVIKEDLAFLKRTAESGELAGIAFNQPRLKKYDMKTVDWYGYKVNVPSGVKISGEAELPCAMYADYLDHLYPLGDSLADGVGIK